MRAKEGRTVGLFTKVSPEEKVDGYIVQLDMGAVLELVKLLRSVSSNVNQIARRCNSTHNLYEQDVEDLRQGYAEIWQGVNDLLKKFEAL